MDGIFGLIIESVLTISEKYFKRVAGDIRTGSPILYRCLVFFFSLFLVIAVIVACCFMIIGIKRVVQ